MAPSGKKSAAAAPRMKSLSKGAKGLGGSSSSGSETITLPDGTQIPTAIPSGVDPALAKAAIEFMKANPEQAKAALGQAQALMAHNPAMVQHMVMAQRQAADPIHAAKMKQLKDDPELKPMFDDIAANGHTAMERYWNDTELMSKISTKMAAMRVEGEEHSKAHQKPRPRIDSLHDAAKAGDLDALKRYLDAGADVNGTDKRGVSPLGMAVGFNRLPAIEALLAGGATVDKRDARGNTVLHYAAGYGRKEAAQALLAAGADIEARNADGQSPLDVAEVNREVHMVKFLTEKGAKAPTGSKYL